MQHLFLSALWIKFELEQMLFFNSINDFLKIQVSKYK